jgi:hypothetical protein
MTKLGFKMVCSACRKDFGVIMGNTVAIETTREWLKEEDTQIMCAACADRLFNQVDLR